MHLLEAIIRWLAAWLGYCWRCGSLPLSPSPGLCAKCYRERIFIRFAIRG